jgi:hypothetical protein
MSEDDTDGLRETNEDGEESNVWINWESLRGNKKDLDKQIEG